MADRLNNSRLVKNFMRDISNNRYRISEEEMSIMNASGMDITITDNTTGTIYVAFPGTIRHIARPKSTLTIEQQGSKVTLPRIDIKRKLISVVTEIPFCYTFVNGESYIDQMAEKWIESAKAKSDILYIVGDSAKLVINDYQPNNYSYIFILIFIVIIIVAVVLLIKNKDKLN